LSVAASGTGRHESKRTDAEKTKESAWPSGDEWSSTVQSTCERGHQHHL
jgi:hypothetical protein